MQITSPSSRVAAVLAGAALAVGALAGPATAGPAPSPAEQGAAWLQAQPTDGLIHNQQFDFDDYGLTADVALGLLALGHQAEADPMVAAVADHVDAWTTYKRQVFAGSVAKAVVLAQTSGGSARDFGGVNLVQRLNDRVSGERPIVGRIEDKAPDDYVNVIGQALATQGLAVAGSGKADEVRDYLLKQQCGKGYFRLNLPGKAKRDQSCDAGSASGISAPDTDVTALAVLALRALPTKTRAVRTAIADAVGWLERRQKDNGSFGGGTSTEASNTNSTGLAAWALGDARSCDAAAAAAAWVLDRQVPSTATGTPLEDEIGAIAYDSAALAAGQSDGITATTRDQWQRASAQAAPALLYLDPVACEA